MGTFGLYYWYLPHFVSRYYESVTDLETNRKLDIDQNPAIKIDWGQGRALTTEDLNKCAMVFTYMAHFNDEQLKNICEEYARRACYL